MPSRRYFTNNAPQQTLNASITSGATSCVINGSFSGWPTQFPFFAELDYGTASAEIISVTGITGTTATIVRAQGGTAAISHAAGATLDHVAVAQDLDEANAHTSASTGVHGISGSVVGTSDVQTLTNKTLATPTLTGTASGVGLSLSGNLSVGAAETITGGSTAASYTASGNGAVKAVLQPTTYANETTATSALGAAAAGTIIFLSSPTTAGTAAGLFQSTGTSWVPVSLPFAPFIGEANSATAVTLSTTSVVAGNGSVTFTLNQQTRVKISVFAQFVPATTTAARYFTQAGYNSGSSVVIGSVTLVGKGANVANDGSTNARTANAFGTAVLTAGTYTAYPAIARSVGGSTTDTANVFYVLVEAIGTA